MPATFSIQIEETALRKKKVNQKSTSIQIEEMALRKKVHEKYTNTDGRNGIEKEESAPEIYQYR